MTTTVNAFDYFALFQFSFGHTAHTVGAEIGVSRLNASQTAQVFIALFFPFGDEISVGYFFVQTIVVQFFADCFSFVVQIVNVARALMMHFENGPENFGFAFAFVRRCFGFTHLLV